MTARSASNEAMKALRAAFLAGAAVGFALTAAGQGTQAPAGRAGHEVTAPVTWHHEMRSLMRELSQELDEMRAQVIESASPEAEAQMAARMRELSAALDKMSGLLARPAHTAEDRAQLAQMRQRLAPSASTSGAAPTTRPRWAADVDATMAQIETQLDALDAQMKQVRAAADPAERSRLLGAHARALRRTMVQVRELDRALGPRMRAMMGGGRHAVSAERMMLAHDLIVRRMALMERLMEQVMEQSMGHDEKAPR